MFDHVGFPVSDHAKSRAFYDAALGALGATVMMEDETSTTLTRDGSAFWFGETGRTTTPIHMAFTAKDRAQVRAFYEAAMAAGGRDNGGPGIRTQYHPNYYAAFVLDPDGHNIEAVCHEAE